MKVTKPKQVAIEMSFMLAFICFLWAGVHYSSFQLRIEDPRIVPQSALLEIKGKVLNIRTLSRVSTIRILVETADRQQKTLDVYRFPERTRSVLTVGDEMVALYDDPRDGELGKEAWALRTHNHIIFTYQETLMLKQKDAEVAEWWRQEGFGFPTAFTLGCLFSLLGAYCYFFMKDKRK